MPTYTDSQGRRITVGKTVNNIGILVGTFALGIGALALKESLTDLYYSAIQHDLKLENLAWVVPSIIATYIGTKLVVKCYRENIRILRLERFLGRELTGDDYRWMRGEP